MHPFADKRLWYQPHFLDSTAASALYLDLLYIKWQQDSYNFGGKTIFVPRLTAWYGDVPYSYSGIKQTPRKWIPELSVIREKLIEDGYGVFNSCLLNFYRTGEDSVAWHSDDEKELGENPIIASISLGATRTFELKSKEKKAKTIQYPLEDGSLLVMSGDLQHTHKHRIPKESEVQLGRINLTFRYMK